jgi:hypothetical protein
MTTDNFFINPPITVPPVNYINNLPYRIYLSTENSRYERKCSILGYLHNPLIIPWKSTGYRNNKNGRIEPDSIKPIGPGAGQKINLSAIIINRKWPLDYAKSGFYMNIIPGFSSKISR